MHVNNIFWKFMGIINLKLTTEFIYNYFQKSSRAPKQKI